MHSITISNLCHLSNSIRATTPPSQWSDIFSFVSDLDYRISDRRSQLPDCSRIARQGVTLSVIKEDRCIFITHAVERHGTLDVWIIASDDMASGNINDILTLVCQQTFDAILGI